MGNRFYSFVSLLFLLPLEYFQTCSMDLFGASKNPSVVALAVFVLPLVLFMFLGGLAVK